MLEAVGDDVPVVEDDGVTASAAVTETTVTNEGGTLEVTPAAVRAPATTGLAQSAVANGVEARVADRAADRESADNQGAVDRVPLNGKGHAVLMHTLTPTLSVTPCSGVAVWEGEAVELGVTVLEGVLEGVIDAVGVLEGVPAGVCVWEG